MESTVASYQFDLSVRIRQIREALGYSQADNAYKCDISPSAYGQIERKAIKASVATLYKIALAMNVSLAFLVDIQNDQLIEKNKL